MLRMSRYQSVMATRMDGYGLSSYSFTLVTRVRIPYGTPVLSVSYEELSARRRDRTGRGQAPIDRRQLWPSPQCRATAPSRAGRSDRGGSEGAGAGGAANRPDPPVKRPAPGRMPLFGR
jgi:hypothetical protein